MRIALLVKNMERSLKGTEEFKFFQDFWNFHQKFYELNSDKECTEAVKMADMIIDRYKNEDFSRFCQSIMLTTLEELDRKWRDKNGIR